MPMTASVLMPISRAAIGFCAVARIAFPSRVYFTNSVRAIMSGTVTPITSSVSSTVNRTGASSAPIRLASGSSLGKFTSCGPPQNRPAFMKMKLTPMADTSGASLGALRSGLYTT